MLRTGLQKVSVENLAFGMYVAKLDRPWLETDFAVQGFHLRDEKTRARLLETCRFVYVDPMKFRRDLSQLGQKHKVVPFDTGRTGKPTLRMVVSNEHLPPRREVPGAGRPALRRVVPKHPKVYEDRVDVAREFVPARTSVEDAVSILRPVIDKVRRSGKIDVDRVEAAVTPLVDSVLRNKDAVAALLRLRVLDDYTYSHSIANAVWAALLGRQLGYGKKQINRLSLGCSLLDIGKVNIPRELLTKPEAPTEAEWETLRGHVEAGLHMLEESNITDRDVIAMVAMHHERIDGSGYPNGLAGNAIPVSAQIAGIVDTYDAMISNRPYAPARSSYEAVNHLLKQADVLFQKELVEQLIQAIGVFPTGTLVELNTGEVGIVKSQNPQRRLRPKVTLVLNENKQPRKQPLLFDLNDMDTDDERAPKIWIKRELPRGSYTVNAADFFGC